MEPARLLPRSVLADQVKERLLDGILTGRFAPDSRIVETQVARELGTSQAPVREALRGLEALGVVEITPFRGARVRRPTRRELLEAYAIRTALESLGARLAVPRSATTTSTSCRRASTRCRPRRATATAHGVAEADARFHGRILELADNATLVRVWRSLEPFSRTYITLVVPGADPQWSADLHVPILAALRRRDVDAVVAALERHFEEVSANMADRLPDDDDGANPMTTDDFVLSEEMVAGPARLRIDVLGGEPRDHVLDDMSFMDYRLADVRIAPEVSVPEPDIVWNRDGEKGDRLRRPADDVHRRLARGAHPEGHRHDARAPDGGGRAPPVPRVGGALPRPDRPVPGRRVEPRQVDGPDRGLPPRREPRLDRDDRDRRGRPGGHGLEERVPQEARPRAPSGPTRPAPQAGVEKFFGDMPTLGAVRRSRAPSTS